MRTGRKFCGVRAPAGEEKVRAVRATRGKKVVRAGMSMAPLLPSLRQPFHLALPSFHTVSGNGWQQDRKYLLEPRGVGRHKRFVVESQLTVI